MGLFGKGHKNTEEREQMEAAAQAAQQQYYPIVRDCLTRLQAWAFPYCQVDGWEIWHADVKGQRVVDVRVVLSVAPNSMTFTVRALAWQDPDLDAGSEYSQIELTAVDLYDALRRAAVQEV